MVHGRLTQFALLHLARLLSSSWVSHQFKEFADLVWNQILQAPQLWQLSCPQNTWDGALNLVLLCSGELVADAGEDKVSPITAVLPDLWLFTCLVSSLRVDLVRLDLPPQSDSKPIHGLIFEDLRFIGGVQGLHCPTLELGLGDAFKPGGEPCSQAGWTQEEGFDAVA